MKFGQIQLHIDKHGYLIVKVYGQTEEDKSWKTVTTALAPQEVNGFLVGIEEIAKCHTPIIGFEEREQLRTKDGGC